MIKRLLALLVLASFGCQTPVPVPPAKPIEEIKPPEAADDWRLKGKDDLDEYLMGVTLIHRSYRPHPEEEWDHDHCKFCDAPFSLNAAHEDPLTVGYVTEDHYHWVCEPCFADFKTRFKWKVVEAKD